MSDADVAVVLAPEATIGRYLIQRLHALGVGHVFGVPGDYVLGLYDQLARGPLVSINTCDEQAAGFLIHCFPGKRWGSCFRSRRRGRGCRSRRA